MRLDPRSTPKSLSLDRADSANPLKLFVLFFCFRAKDNRARFISGA